MSCTDPSKGEVVEILRIAPGGEGVARCSSGEVVFVPGSVPGDILQIGDYERHRGVLRARLLRVVQPSPDRRTPPCPYASDCGGCDFMQLVPEAQRRAKLSMLVDALERIGGCAPPTSNIEFVAAGDESFRSRLRLHVDAEGHVGMYSTRSHRVVPIHTCHVSDARINTAIARLNSLDAKQSKRLSFCEQIELRSSEYAPTLLARLFPRKGVQLRPELYTAFFSADTVVTVAVSAEDDTVSQDYLVTDEITIKVPASAFSQVCGEVNRKLVRAVLDAAERRGHRTFLDAYAGAGNFTVPLLCAGLKGQAVDVCAGAILAARAVTRDLGLPFTGFDVGDARAMLEHYARTKRQFDFIILDPPRQGAKSVVDAALRLRPRTIALVACDPVALARDLGDLTKHGARVDSLTVFDMFRETHHIETLAIVDCE